MIEQFLKKNSNIPLLEDVIDLPDIDSDLKEHKSEPKPEKSQGQKKEPQPKCRLSNTSHSPHSSQTKQFAQDNEQNGIEGSTPLSKPLPKPLPKPLHKADHTTSKASLARHIMDLNSRIALLEQPSGNQQHSITNSPVSSGSMSTGSLFSKIKSRPILLLTITFLSAILVIAATFRWQMVATQELEQQHQLKLFFLEQLNQTDSRIENRLLALELLAEMEGNQRIRAWAQDQLETIQVSEQQLLQRLADSEWALQMEHFAWPIDKSNLDPKAIKYENYKRGIKIAANLGDPVLAVEDGVVIYSDKKIKGYGNLILIRHSEELMTVYGHNYANYVQVGDKIKQGQMIGVVGEVPGQEESALYFEVRFQGVAEDPFNYLQF